MIAFIDDHRQAYGVEPICKVLPIAPSSYREHMAQRRDPAKLSARAQHDLKLTPEIARIFAENFATACARSGGSCGGKDLRSHAAPWSG